MAHDLPRILSEVKKSGFPELSGIPVTPDWKRLTGSFMHYGEYFTIPGFYVEVDSKTLGKAPAEVLRGFFAHELVHVTDHLTSNRFIHSFLCRLYKISQAYRGYDERWTDRQTILRGFGPNLLIAREYAHDMGFDSEEESLTLEEIRKLLENPAIPTLS